MKTKFGIIIALLLTLTLFSPYILTSNTAPKAAIPAFPGAEGFGSETIGGRGGQVLAVTNLNDSGPGSLRAAIETSGPRIIVFRTGGTITLESPLKITEPFVTIAGQTAPGGGMTLRNDPGNTEPTLAIKTHDVVIRYLRFRSGPSTEKSQLLDSLEIGNNEANDVYNVVVDHNSLSWSTDETLDVWYQTHDISLQWNIISEGLDCSTHLEGCHSKGIMLGKSSQKISLHHNLIAHQKERNPRIANLGSLDIVNNVIYNPTFGGGWGPSHSTGFAPVNYVGNFYKAGVTSGTADYLVSASDATQIYVQGNITPKRPDDSLDEADGVVRPENQQWVVGTRHTAPMVTTLSATDAYTQVLDGAGANMMLSCDGTFVARRDTVDERIVNDVKNGTGTIINDPSDVGGWPLLTCGTPCTDSDNDGMSDEWETMHGFNPNSAADGPLDFDNDGYTNIEEFLNGTNPKVAEVSTAQTQPVVWQTPPPSHTLPTLSSRMLFTTTTAIYLPIIQAPVLPGGPRCVN